MKKHRIIAFSISSVILLLVGGVVFVMRQDLAVTASVATARMHKPAETPFPALNTSGLSELQIRILTLAKAEYAKKPISYDTNVLRYTDGNKEAWCADFVSWIMQQSGVPLTNPHSGNWRIPGVLTLQEYYQTTGRYTQANDHTPKPGDLAFYIGDHTYDPRSRQHVAMVVSVDGNRMTTLGGNEGGHLKLNTQIIKLGENSLAGFGQLQ